MPKTVHSVGFSGSLGLIEGRMIADKFRVERVIGEGGMGVVVAARHVQLDEHVALKFLRQDLAADGKLVLRFLQEARDAVKLKSEYVARTFDVGVEDGAPYIVMEFLEGRDLGHELAAKGTLPIDVAADYMVQACAGVAAAHARGIVHRDIKPENLFIAERGDGSSVLKILDFGISKAVLGNKSQHDGVRGPIVGSPYYMSPEQLSGGEVDVRSDIWSLGAVLFELLAGVTAFDHELPIARLLEAIVRDPPRRLTDFRPMAPPELEQLIERCLEKDPADRFPSAGDLAIALLRFAPKSARVPAERASTITRAAGLSSEKNLELPPSNAPPALDDRSSGSRYAAAERASGSVPTLGARSTPASVPSIASGVMSGVGVEAAPPKSNRNALIGLAIATVLVAILAVVAFLRTGGQEPVAATGPVASTPPIAPPAPSALAAVDPPAQPIASAAATDAGAGAASASASARAPVPPWVGRKPPVPAPPPQTGAPSPPSRPDLDIRMTR